MTNSFLVSAIILAGGVSRRMNKKNKLIADVNGTPMVNQTVNSVKKSNAIETIVVTGHESELIQKVLSKYSVKFVNNPNYRNGLSSSLICGIKAVSKKSAGAIVILGDMPWVNFKTLNTLIDHFNLKNGKTICVPIFKGLIGNPRIWPRILFPAIKNIRGDIGAKKLIDQYSENVSRIEVNDAAIHMDINNADDLKFIPNQ